MDFKFPYFSWHVPLIFSKYLYFDRNKALSASLFWVSNFTILSAILLLLDLRKDSYCLYLEILRNGVSNKRTFLQGHLQKTRVICKKYIESLPAKPRTRQCAPFRAHSHKFEAIYFYRIIVVLFATTNEHDSDQYHEKRVFSKILVGRWQKVYHTFSFSV